MDLQFLPLNDSTLEEAIRIAVEGNTGSEPDVRRRLKRDNQYFAAINRGKILGEIGWYKDDGSYMGKTLGDAYPTGEDIFWVRHFAVYAKFRGHGIGKFLMTSLEKVVQKLGARELWVYTDQARGFYEKNGFTFVQKVLLQSEWEDVLQKKFV